MSEEEAQNVDVDQLRLIDVDQLAELWGVKKSWIYDEVESGRLHARRLGRQLRFAIKDLADYLDE